MKAAERRFVVQVHSGCGATHYDLMIEQDQALATWQLAASPEGLAPGQTLSARKLADHRKAYLTYEGPVSGNRGQVRILDTGRCQLTLCREGHWEFQLRGTTIRGRFALTRQAGEQWTLHRLE